MKSAPQCGPGKSRSTTVRDYTLLCICKSSKQTGNLPGGMWQAGHTARQCGSGYQKPQCGRNWTNGWNVKWPAIRAWGQYHSRVLDRRASAGCCEGATAEKAVPFPSDCPSIP